MPLGVDCVHHEASVRTMAAAAVAAVLAASSLAHAFVPLQSVRLRVVPGLPRHAAACRRAPSLRASADGGQGELVFSAASEQNGEVQVRELAQGGGDDGAVVRALWFSSSPGVWQSAVSMKRVGEKLEPDWSVLPFPSSRAHAFASALVVQPEDAAGPGAFAQTAMLLGLGGGTLAGWLLQNLPQLSLLTCSELDADVQKIATSYFGLDESDPRLSLQLGDGLEHAAQAKADGRSFDLVAVDVGGSQVGLGFGV